MRLLAALAAHSHICTTQRYIDVKAEQLASAVELLLPSSYHMRMHTEQRTRPTRPAPNPELRAFHEGKTFLASGFNRAGLLTLSDADFDRYHGFIQWAFPTPEQSYHNFSAPLLDHASAVWMAQDLATIEFLEAMTERFLVFLKNTNAWRAKHHHTHLRITRVLNSLRILHSYELATWFHHQVQHLAGDHYQLMTKAHEYWDRQINPVHDRIAGAMVGLAIGDALGAPVEFLDRGSFAEVTGYRDGGRFNLPAGAWTDDTAMALCLADSIIENRGFDPRDLLERFCSWAEHGTNSSTGVAVGIGQNTLRSLGEFRRSGNLKATAFGNKSDGNGSIMRLAPIVCFAYGSFDDSMALAEQQSHTTHASPIAAECCRFLAGLMQQLLVGKPYDDAKANVLAVGWSPELTKLVAEPLTGRPVDAVPSDGFAPHTLAAAMWSVENSNCFADAVLLAVNLGHDADTTAAVTGQLAGARYGYNYIDPHLKLELIDEARIYVSSQLLR